MGKKDERKNGRGAKETNRVGALMSCLKKRKRREKDLGGDVIVNNYTFHFSAFAPPNSLFFFSASSSALAFALSFSPPPP